MTNLQNYSFRLFSSRSSGGASRLLFLQLLLCNELFLLAKAELRLGRPGAPSHGPCWASRHWQLMLLQHSISGNTAQGVQLTHLPADPLHMSTLRLGAIAVEDSPCSPLPSLPTQTRSRPRLLCTGSWMVLPFLGSVVLWGHRSLFYSNTKKTTMCKTHLETAHSRAVSSLLLLLSFPASGLLQPKRNMGVSHLL